MSDAADRKKRGAQPKNLNALRHGFYSRAFNQVENTDLDTLMTEGLSDEINMLRVVTRRVMSLAQDAEDIEETTMLLGALGMAATRLAGLLRTQKMLGQQQDDTNQAISDALASVIAEMELQ
jgi:hypothetical protein